MILFYVVVILIMSAPWKPSFSFLLSLTNNNLAISFFKSYVLSISPKLISEWFWLLSPVLLAFLLISALQFYAPTLMLALWRGWRFYPLRRFLVMQLIRVPQILPLLLRQINLVVLSAIPRLIPSFSRLVICMISLSLNLRSSTSSGSNRLKHNCTCPYCILSLVFVVASWWMVFLQLSHSSFLSMPKKGRYIV